MDEGNIWVSSAQAMKDRWLFLTEKKKKATGNGNGEARALRLTLP